jgi:hypothetical protein
MVSIIKKMQEPPLLENDNACFAIDPSAKFKKRIEKEVIDNQIQRGNAPIDLWPTRAFPVNTNKFANPDELIRSFKYKPKNQEDSNRRRI